MSKAKKAKVAAAPCGAPNNPWGWRGCTDAKCDKCYPVESFIPKKRG